MTPAVFCWSGGKDSALCLHKVLQGREYGVKYILTTLSGEYGRISMHGVREELLDAQSKALGIPSVKVHVYEGTNSEYEEKMEKALLGLKAQGIEHVIFGDIFLDDLRKYREDNLAKVGMKAVFPLWKQDTTTLLEEFIFLQFKTIICCTNDAYLGKEWAGKHIDASFVSSLPDNVDPCGENGEYHTFCFDGPVFKMPVKVNVGETVFKPLAVKSTDDCNLPAAPTRGFWFCELT